MKKNSAHLVCILVVLVLVSQALPASASIGLAYPISSRTIIQGFSEGGHTGSDFSAAEWTPIKASAGGTVTMPINPNLLRCERLGG